MELFKLVGDHTIEAAQRRTQADGEKLLPYDASFNSDTSSNDESDQKPKTKFDLRMLFQLKPSIAGASGIDNHNLIRTRATCLTNTTMEIYEEVNNTEFNKTFDTEDCTVISGVTESTTYTSPPHSKDSDATSGKGSVICGSLPPPLSNWMDLEEQDEDDDNIIIMDLGSDNKTDGSQTDNQVNFSSPLNEGPMAAESITKKSGYNQ